jgi:hypothetical protein
MCDIPARIARNDGVRLGGAFAWVDGVFVARRHYEIPDDKEKETDEEEEGKEVTVRVRSVPPGSVWQRVVLSK